MSASERPSWDECWGCGSRYVHHVEARPLAGRRWWLRLRCGECGRWEAGTHDHASVLALDERLERAEGELLEALIAVTADNMADWVERFTRALRTGGIQPDDF